MKGRAATEVAAFFALVTPKMNNMNFKTAARKNFRVSDDYEVYVCKYDYDAIAHTYILLIELVAIDLDMDDDDQMGYRLEIPHKREENRNRIYDRFDQRMATGFFEAVKHLIY